MNTDTRSETATDIEMRALPASSPEVPILKIIFPVCLILLGIAGFRHYNAQHVKFQRKPVVKTAPVVDVMTMTPTRETARIRAMGTVRPDREVVIRSRVAGTVIQVSPAFVQGGLIRHGEIIVRIDPADYTLAVNKARSALTHAQAGFDIEKGRQQIAREEFRLMAETSPGGIPAARPQSQAQTGLVLRKPQLEQARAAVARAQSDLDAARLALKRTRIPSPFHALVRSRAVDVGGMIAVQGALATLVDVSCYQVEVQVPLDRLDHIRAHETDGSPVRVRSLHADRQWDGRVVRTTGVVTGQSRMAGVIIRVDDPLGLAPAPGATSGEGSGPGSESGSARGRPAMLLDDHVEVSIQCQVFDPVFLLPRAVMRENSSVWIYSDGHLEIRKVAPVWIEDDRVFIQSGLSPGDLVISSELPAPVSGMALTPDSGEGE